jgi:hypothetical protein
MRLLGVPLLPLALGLGGIVDLTLAMVLHLRMRQLKRRSEFARASWLSVPAKIVYSKVEELPPTKWDEVRHKAYSARFRYEYVVEGTRHEGTQYTLAKEWSSTNREPHEKEAREFPEGREVKVWVNPSDHAESVLKLDASAFPDITVPLFVMILFGLGLLGAALVMGLVKKG